MVIDKGFDRLTRSIANSDRELNSTLIKGILLTAQQKENQNVYNYYFLSRIIGKILNYSPELIKEIPKYYIDENFIKECASTCPESVKHMRKSDRNIYLNKGILFDMIRYSIRSARYTKALVRLGVKE